MDNLAVKAYRDKFKLCPSPGFRKDIVVTVKHLHIWEEIINNWGYWKPVGYQKRGHVRPGESRGVQKWKKKNPRDIKAMLDTYEIWAEKENAVQQKDSRVHRTESLPERPARGMPEQRLPTLLERQSGWK